MAAILALVAFLVALLLHLARVDTWTLDLLLAGLALIAAHLAWPWAPWRRPPGA